MTATTTLMTADELERMPEDAYRHDLIRGVLTRMSPTGFRHLKVTGDCNALLHAHVATHDLGVVGGEGGFVMEIVSPSDTRVESEEKVDLYLAAGAPLVIVVDPRRRTVRVRTPNGGAVLPGFRVPVARLFA